MAELEIFPAKPADLLPGKLHHLPGLPYDTVGKFPAGLWSEERHVCFASLARGQHRRALLLWIRRTTAEDDGVPEVGQLLERGHLRVEKGQRRKADCTAWFGAFPVGAQ